MNLDNLISEIAENESEKDRVELVFRITTNQYHDKNGICYKRSIKYLKRKCYGFNILDEDCSNVGASEIIPRILNFHTVDDGIYTVTTINETRDWESGYIDDYDYELVSYIVDTEQTKNQS